MKIYKGTQKVGEFDSYERLRIGDKKPVFVHEGSNIVYPNPVKDGLVLWYDFSGRTNSDAERGVAEDLSGNGNHGTLQNFNYTAESGYNKNQLLFDGIDDVVEAPNISSDKLTFIISLKNVPGSDNIHTSEWNLLTTYLSRINNNILSLSMTKAEGGQEVIRGYDVFSNVEEEVKTVGFIITTESASIIADGVVLETRDDLNIRVPSLRNIGKWRDNHWNSSIYDVKIYNRPLTPEEIAHNYAIEKERFGIE